MVPNYLRCSLRSVGRLFEFFNLLIEVVIEAALNDSRMRLLDLVPIKIYKKKSDIVEEFVNPGKVEEGLIDGLGK